MTEPVEILDLRLNTTCALSEVFNCYLILIRNFGIILRL